MNRKNIKKIAVNLLRPKLEYTKEELTKEGWATIGGRIQDYAEMLVAEGPKKTYKKIKSTYSNGADDVYRGLKVYMIYGTDAYYDKDLSVEKHPDNKKYFK